MSWQEVGALAGFADQTSAFPATYTGWIRIQSSETGTITAARMRVRTLGTGVLRLGVYTENPATNHPQVLLDSGTVTPAIAGYAEVTLSAGAGVLNNEWIWVGWQVSVDASAGHKYAYDTSAASDRYRSNVGYTDGLPADAGTTYPSSAAWWGAFYVTIAGTTTSTSTSTSSSTSTTMTSTSISTTQSTSTSISTSTTSTSISTSLTTSTSQSTSLSTSTTSTSISTSTTISTSTSISFSTSTTSTSISTSLSTTTSTSSSLTTSLTTSTSVSQSTSTTSTSISTTATTLLPVSTLREVCNIEHDVILVPDTDSADEYAYRRYSALDLFGFSRRMLRSYSGFGLSPLHFIVQRGPYQDGDTALDMRLDPRVVQLVIAEPLFRRQDYWDRRNDLLDLLRPNRSFDGTARPLIYQKWLPGGKFDYGSDGVTTAWSTTFTSHTGRFVERGLGIGDRFEILTSGVDAGVATVASVINDYTITLTEPMNATATGVRFRFRRGWSRRNLYCLLEAGPTFDEGTGAAPLAPTGYREVLRLVANDPCWYTDEILTHTWSTATTAQGDLVFQWGHAWLGETDGTGRWLFDISYVGQTISIVYWGTVRARPTITITGPAVDPTIENTTTGASITMDYFIAAGEVVTIDTLALTVTNADDTNLLPYTDGDLATFGLEPPPQAPNRINNVVISFSSAETASAAVMTWRNRYIGI